MCGFAGVVAWGQRFRVSRDDLARMSACVAHRGPDGQGLFLNHDGAPQPDRPQVGMVHRRLAVLDPDPRANQPFDDAHGNRLVFNGEIYNYRELRAELTGLDRRYVWRTEGDTEVLLRAYAVWGRDCLQRLNGMFSFAVWDDRARALFLAIDRMGQKPLYWAALDSEAQHWTRESDAAHPLAVLAFASELSALRTLPWFCREISPSALGNYFRWGYIPAPLTIYRGAAKLPPARWMSTSAGRVESGSYFDPNECSETHDKPAETDAIARTRGLLTQAVHRQLVSDVPIGCFLSGGVDSSVIAAAMKASVEPAQPVLTFSIGFDDPRYDETRYAAQVARHLGTRHHEFLVRPDAAVDLPALAEVFGEPFADSSALPTHYLARQTRQHVKVALSGDGGDELFGGYDRYRAMRLAMKLDRLPAPLRRALASDLLQHLPGSHPKSTLSRFKRLLATVGSCNPLHRYKQLMTLFSEQQIQGLLASQLNVDPREADAMYDECAPLFAGRDAVQSALAIDRVTYLPHDLLVKVDRASMLHALEVRSPFMDPDLVRFAAGLTSDQLLRGGSKRLLREAFAKDLPESVFRRRKMGFAVPIGEWLQGKLRPMLHDLLFAKDSFATAHLNLKVVRALIDEHQSKKQDHAQRLYALLMLELWWRSSRA